MAHLNGKKRVAVCAYWGMGWGYTQAENVARTNLNYALGINLYNTHGVLYSLLAGRNEWVPPETHFYQPYWHTWRTFADYVSRLSYVLSQGTHRADVAILYPLSTIHAQWHGGSKFDPPAQEAQSTTFALAKTLYANLLDFDIIDEARLAGAHSEKAKLKIGELEFPVIVLPSMTTIRSDALAKLRKFVEAGGTLVVFRQPPAASAEAGRDDPELAKTWQALLGDYTSGGVAAVKKRNDAGGRTILVHGSEAEVVKAIRSSIQPDVTTTETELAHTHQQVGDRHVFYFVNRRQKTREVGVTVRAQGRPEVWDARTGEIRPLYRFRAVEAGTSLRLTMGPGAGVLVVLQPETAGPQVVDDNLASVQSVTKKGGEVEVVGTASATENIHARVTLDGKEFAGSVATSRPESSISLDGLWECEYRPTMNNKWGDYRFPASDEMIGPEVPCMKYRAESTSAKVRSTWEAAEFKDDDWQRVTCTFGPYWQVLEPLAANLDSDNVQKKIISGTAKQADAIELDGKMLRWQPYVYSWTLGANRSDVHQAGFEGIGSVPAEFLVFNGSRSGPPAVRYVTTRVYSPRTKKLYLDFGGTAKSPARQAWVNGEKVVDVIGKPLSALPQVTLQKGWNSVVLRVVHAGSRPLATYAVFHSQPQTPEQPRFMPLSRWHDLEPDLVYDCRPDRQESVGWYRFLAPPGAKQAKLNLISKSVEAWINGRAVNVVDDRVQFPNLLQSATQAIQVALRVRHKSGYYEGAAFKAPVSFECSKGQIPLGDWSGSGLQYYSGGIKYSRRVQLQDLNESPEVLLDLGDVRTSAQVSVNGRSLGVRLAPPFVFDLSAAVKPGDNEIEVEALNTLANFMSAGPSKFVFKGQTVSGLLGPVTLRTVPRVRVPCQPVRDSQRAASGGLQ